MFRTFPRWSGLLAALVLVVSPVEAQIGGLIRRGAQQIIPPPPPANQDVYTTDLVELTPDVLDKVIAGKQAGKQFATSPAGPAAIRRQHDEALRRADDFHTQNGSVIEAWEERLRRQRECVDSSYGAFDELRSNEFQDRMAKDPALMQRIIALTPRIAAAQQRADTAELGRLTAELKALKAPTAADSAAVRRTCALPPPPPAYAQAKAMRDQVDSLAVLGVAAEAQVARLEARVSGMSAKQLGLACERIAIYLVRLDAKKAQDGFSPAELEALDRQKAALARLCS